MKVYLGARGRWGHFLYVQVCLPSGRKVRLARGRIPGWRFSNVRHWGDKDAGCYQLAYDLLCNATDSPVCALDHYQRFTEEVLAPLKARAWSMRHEDIIAWIDEGIPVGTM